LFGSQQEKSIDEHSGNGRKALVATRGPADMSTTSATAAGIVRTDQTYFAALLASVSASRRYVRSVCSDWQRKDENIAVAEMLVSELTANAVVASGVKNPMPVCELSYRTLPIIGVRLLDLDDSLVIEVWDSSPQPPRLIQPAADAEHGRGLQLVDALSLRWGHYDADFGGKVVWCQLGQDDGPGQTAAQDEIAFDQIIEALCAQAWNGVA